MTSLGPPDIKGWTRAGSAQREAAAVLRVSDRSGASFSLHAEKPAAPLPGGVHRSDTRMPSASDSARSDSDAAGSAKTPAAEAKAPDHAPLRQRPTEKPTHPKPEKDVAGSETSGSEPSAAASDDAEAAADTIEASPPEDDASAQANETVPEIASQPPTPATPSITTPSGRAPTGAVPPNGGAEAQAEGPPGAEPGRQATGSNELGGDGQAAAPRGTGVQNFEASLAAAQADPVSSLQYANLPDGQGALAQGQISATSPTAEAKPAAATAPTAQAMPSVPLGAVPMTIGLRALGATSRFEIRLDPIELGRIDVALDIDRTRGAVAASLIVDRPETLALLQRDASSLQQALSQAGLDASQGITLSLRGGDQGGRNEHGTDPRRPGGPSATGEAIDTSPGIETLPLRALRAISGIDIRI